MCAGKELWTVQTEMRQVKRPDEELNNALAWALLCEQWVRVLQPSK